MPKAIAHFRLNDALHSNGDIVLYKADEDLPGGASRKVLVRTFPAFSAKDKTIEERFHTQVGRMALLTGNPYVVSLLSAGVTDNQPWIAMEFLAETVAGLHGERPAEPAVIEKMLRQIASVLEVMHGWNPPILHNAVLPSNIHSDALNNFRLGGFDASAPAASETAYTAASIQYAAPEMLSQELGRPGPASDLYALGHVAYELALGSRLYRPQFPAVFDPKDPKHEATTAKWMAWHYSMGAKVAPVADLVKDFPQALSDIIAKLIAKSLGERYANAAAVIADLDRANLSGIGLPPDGPATSRPSQAATSATPMTPATPVNRTPPRSFARPAAAPADPNAPKYFLRLRGRMTGPFDLPTLQRHLKQGAVSRLHEVSTDRQTWQPATSVEGLFGGPPQPLPEG